MVEQKPVVRASHRKAVFTVLDSVTGPFRRSTLSNALYSHTSPRSHPVADRLADALMKELSKAGVIQRHGHLHWVKVSQQRALKSGRAVPELPEVVDLRLTTRCPSKWVSVDLETGDIWVGSQTGWRRAGAEEQSDAAALLTK